MNEVALEGKVSRVSPLKYTPSGKPSLDFTLAVTQRVLDKVSVGYVEVVLFGDSAEDSAQILKIGRRISVRGQLWGRSYRNRQGAKVNETKVLCASVQLAEPKEKSLKENRND